MKVGIEDLTQLEILRSVFTLAFVIISILMGIKMISKYFSLKNHEILTVGLTWIFLSSSWWSNAFSFLTILLFGYAFEDYLYLLLLNAFTPLAIICWIYSFSHIVYSKYKYHITILYLLVCLSFLFYVLIALSIDTTLIGARKGTFDYSRTTIPLLFALFSLATAIVTGLIFSSKSMKSTDPIVQWKGRFLLFAILSFVGASILDTLFVGPYGIFRIIVRLILIASGIGYYFAFFLPTRLAEILIRR
ncbi:MAG: hypothetical protein GF383_12330 [Candidatus Lokiarchaeota archaeon]|nr:hypothetical protein [Candidatus Lokiarchaeota archaeon]MBD3341787.1 hypothetical protein [Candidatus Lokiarchaeota archaeon]